MSLFDRQERLKAQLEREAKYGTRMGRPRNEEIEAAADPPRPSSCECPGCGVTVQIADNRLENHKGRYGLCKWSGRAFDPEGE